MRLAAAMASRLADVEYEAATLLSKRVTDAVFDEIKALDDPQAAAGAIGTRLRAVLDAMPPHVRTAPCNVRDILAQILRIVAECGHPDIAARVSVAYGIELAAS
jgi:hypothetical protein